MRRSSAASQSRCCYGSAARCRKGRPGHDGAATSLRSQGPRRWVFSPRSSSSSRVGMLHGSTRAATCWAPLHSWHCLPRSTRHFAAACASCWHSWASRCLPGMRDRSSRRLQPTGIVRTFIRRSPSSTDRWISTSFARVHRASRSGHCQRHGRRHRNQRCMSYSARKGGRGSTSSSRYPTGRSTGHWCWISSIPPASSLD